MNRSLSTTVLQQQNVTFKGTGGVSQENQSCGFAPAFYDTRSRVADISRFANGMPAPVHLLDDPVEPDRLKDAYQFSKRRDHKQ